MTTRLFFLSGLVGGLGLSALQASDGNVSVPVPRTAAPALTSPAPEQPRPAHVYEQKLYGGRTETLIAPEKADAVVSAFRTAYERLGRPRIAFFVNRDLVDERSGLKLTARKEKTESTLGSRTSQFEADAAAAKPEASAQTQVNVAVGGGNAGSGQEAGIPGRGSAETKTPTVTGENTYESDNTAAPTLADRLTVREIETLFGRPFRFAGATLADQRIAASLLADRPIDHLTTGTSETARKDREALAKVADVVIEVLVSSRNVTVANVSGDKTLSVPDIQVSAVRLSDAAVIGQASAADVLGRDRDAGRIVSQFDAREITEATALALMEDIAAGAK